MLNRFWFSADPALPTFPPFGAPAPKSENLQVLPISFSISFPLPLSSARRTGVLPAAVAFDLPGPSQFRSCRAKVRPTPPARDTVRDDATVSLDPACQQVGKPHKFRGASHPLPQRENGQGLGGSSPYSLAGGGLFWSMRKQSAAVPRRLPWVTASKFKAQSSKLKKSSETQSPKRRLGGACARWQAVQKGHTLFGSRYRSKRHRRARIVERFLGFEACHLELFLSLSFEL